MPGDETAAILARLDVRYTMPARANTEGIAAAIAAMDPDAWVDINCTPRRGWPK